VELARQVNHLRQKRKPMSKRIGSSKQASSIVMSRSKSSSGKKSELKTSLYSSKIIKAGALLSDTKTLLSAWDPSLSVSENLRQIRCKNLLGKASRSRADEILAIFRQRYLAEETVARALSTLVKRKCDKNTLERILYFHAVRSDSLLHDVVIELLVPQWSRGAMDIDVQEIESALREWVQDGKTYGAWSNYTIRRVTRGVLATLRDFGVLQGAVKKRIAPAYLPIQAFSYIAFYLKQHQPSGIKLLDLNDWKLFFLAKEGVERFFLEAHQHGLLEYHVAGSVTRLTFPATSLEEYAYVITN